MQQITPIQTSPLPMLDGVAASYLWIPEGNWNNLLDFLLQHFPNVSEEQWKSRIAKKTIVDANGVTLKASSQIKRGMRIFYYREIEDETPIPFFEQIIHEDSHLLVVDKPHFLPVTPGGRFLHETLLTRLKKKFNNEYLTPIHRLDRETAGVILFSKTPETRGLYQSLFHQRKVDKIYHALAPCLPEKTFPLIHRIRMIEAEKFFVMQEVSGEPNSETTIKIIENRGVNNLYELRPLTGKRHQLRVHLASLGAAIVNDGFYPAALPCKGDDYSAPLQLLAKSIVFIDPVSNEHREFSSIKNL